MSSQLKQAFNSVQQQLTQTPTRAQRAVRAPAAAADDTLLPPFALEVAANEEVPATREASIDSSMRLRDDAAPERHERPPTLTPTDAVTLSDDDDEPETKFELMARLRSAQDSELEATTPRVLTSTAVEPRTVLVQFGKSPTIVYYDFDAVRAA